MRANLGCGEHRAEGWVNVDLHSDGPSPDVVASILALPFADGSADLVYLGHVLEHVSETDVPAALAEVRRVLADDGRVAIIGPDIGRTRLYEPVLIPGVLFGGRRWRGDEHRWTATGERTFSHVRAGKFRGRLVEVEDLDEVWPVVDRTARWQFAIEAEKEF